MNNAVAAGVFVYQCSKRKYYKKIALIDILTWLNQPFGKTGPHEASKSCCGPRVFQTF